MNCIKRALLLNKLFIFNWFAGLNIPNENIKANITFKWRQRFSRTLVCSSFFILRNKFRIASVHLNAIQMAHQKCRSDKKSGQTFSFLAIQIITECIVFVVDRDRPMKESNSNLSFAYSSQLFCELFCCECLQNGKKGVAINSRLYVECFTKCYFCLLRFFLLFLRLWMKGAQKKMRSIFSLGLYRIPRTENNHWSLKCSICFTRFFFVCVFLSLCIFPNRRESVPIQINFVIACVEWRYLNRQKISHKFNIQIPNNHLKRRTFHIEWKMKMFFSASYSATQKRNISHILFMVGRKFSGNGVHIKVL